MFYSTIFQFKLNSSQIILHEADLVLLSPMH